MECPAGTYAAAGSTKCTKCPKGAHCPTKTLEMYILCANGTYSDTEGSSDCKLCDAGFRCPNVGMEAPLVCPNGTYSNTTGSVECILCPAGYRWGWVFFHWHISFAHHQSYINERKFVKTKEIHCRLYLFTQSMAAASLLRLSIITFNTPDDVEKEVQ